MSTEPNRKFLVNERAANAARWKTSRPEKVDGLWRIRRHDGELVGFYVSRELAQREVDNRSWFG